MNIRFDPPVKSLADLLHRLGDIPANRVRFSPVPGTATIRDQLKPANEGCELVDGTLVEKPVGQEESRLAMWLGMVFNQFVLSGNLGVVLGEQGMLEFRSGLVRGPDVTFISWWRMRGRRAPKAPIPRLSADVVVEILSRSNTRAEMARKRGDYFSAGVRLVWEIDPRKRAVRACTALDRSITLTADDTHDGRDVLPGFTLPLADLFAELDRHG